MPVYASTTGHATYATQALANYVVDVHFRWRLLCFWPHDCFIMHPPKMTRPKHRTTTYSQPTACSHDSTTAENNHHRYRLHFISNHHMYHGVCVKPLHAMCNNCLPSLFCAARRSFIDLHLPTPAHRRPVTTVMPVGVAVAHNSRFITSSAWSTWTFHSHNFTP